MIRSSRGQATAETALLLPVLALLALALVQVGVAVHARIMVTHAAREAVRVAAVGGSVVAATDAAAVAGGLAPQRLDVSVDRAGTVTTVHLRYRMSTDVPLIGGAVGDLTFTATAAMRSERSGDP